MAIEIRELKITGYINKEAKKNQQSNASSSLTPEDIHRLTKKIKAECVEEVLDILERKNRR